MGGIQSKTHLCKITELQYLQEEIALNQASRLDEHKKRYHKHRCKVYSSQQPAG